MRHVIKLIIAVIIIMFFIVYYYNKNESQVEYGIARRAEYTERYTTGRYMLGTYRTGNTQSKYKIIGLSDVGVNDFSVKMYYVNDDLSEDADLLYIDRAGYGLSEDTTVNQDIDTVVDNYRTALKNAKIEGPFILMAHGYGGVYATYWENKYPEDISGVIYIDGTVLQENNYELGFNYLDYLHLAMNKVGLNRYYENFDSLSDFYTPESVELSRIMNIRSSMTLAKITERRNMKESLDKAYASISQNEIPKMYITSTVFKTSEEYKAYISWYNKRMDAQNKDLMSVPNDEETVELVSESQINEFNDIIPFTESLGNTKVYEVYGKEMIFEENHKELSDLIRDFINEL